MTALASKLSGSEYGSSSLYARTILLRMGRSLAAVLVMLGAQPDAAMVELRTSNSGLPGELEVLDYDGGVLFRQHLESEGAGKVPAADRYRVRFLRPDAGALTTRVNPAHGVVWMHVRVDYREAAVDTYEPVLDVSLDVQRDAATAPQYRLTNHKDETFFVLPMIHVNDFDDNNWSRCWAQRGKLKPGQSVNIGWLDETCLLDGAKKVQAYIELASIDEDDRNLRRRRYVVRADVTAGNAKSRWVPDAGETPWCICNGTEVGPDHDVLIDSSGERRTFKRGDGGTRVDANYGPLRVGDHEPYELPPGAAGNPDFSEWR